MKPASLASFLLILIVTMRIESAFADGGQLQFRHVSGACIITLFTSSTTLRPGTTGVSVMVQNRSTDDPVMNAGVKLSFRSENGVLVQTNAQREGSSNKLLYAADVHLPTAGKWRVEIDVQRGQDFCSTSGEIIVQPAKPAFFEYSIYFLIPPVVIALFILHQWLKERQNSRHHAP